MTVPLVRVNAEMRPTMVNPAGMVVPVQVPDIPVPVIEVNTAAETI